uniref:Uncharacterized protein n=1 Tax=Glossina brevipalpis TaxID=37001 RepID=A0A1A9W0J3_9MUSC
MHRILFWVLIFLQTMLTRYKLYEIPNFIELDSGEDDNARASADTYFKSGYAERLQRWERQYPLAFDIVIKEPLSNLKLQETNNGRDARKMSSKYCKKTIRRHFLTHKTIFTNSSKECMSMFSKSSSEKVSKLAHSNSYSKSIFERCMTLLKRNR